MYPKAVISQKHGRKVALSFQLIGKPPADVNKTRIQYSFVGPAIKSLRHYINYRLHLFTGWCYIKYKRSYF